MLQVCFVHSFMFVFSVESQFKKHNTSLTEHACEGKVCLPVPSISGIVDHVEGNVKV